jgi:diguanylate cyclase (GGDEF)-like protein
MSELSGNILIVDDLPENLQLLAQMLKNQGYKVRKAINGETALRACQFMLPDVILLDIKMPDRDGYEVCQDLKNNPETQDIPVIFISALNDIFDKVRAFEVGGIDYITKPFQEQEVIARIKSQLTIQHQKKLLQQEVQKHQETSEMLYQSRALISGVLNSSLDGIAALQAIREPSTGNIGDFRCLVVNPVIAKFLGKNSQDLITKFSVKRLLAKFDPNLFKKFVHIVETGESLEEDLYYESESTQDWYHFIAVKLGDGFAISVRNITNRKQTELNLDQANKILKDLAYIDELTQIKNRRYFDQYLTQEWRRCLREKQVLSLIMCDVDYFKLYNDYYGHPQGDICLKKVAQTINNTIQRPADIVARYGGEEFVVVLPNTPEDGALHIANLIRNKVQLLHIPHGQSKVNKYVSLSLGIASLIPSLETTPEMLIGIADQALYQAKLQGRNQVFIIRN